MQPLALRWDEILAAEPSDWSHLSLELRLADPDRMEQALTVLSPLNPWRRDDDFRSSVVTFRSARTSGYGAAWQLVRARLALLDEHGIEGALRVLRAVDAARLMATQGPR